MRMLEIFEDVVLRVKPQHLIIMGDFNFPEIDFEHETVAAGENDAASLFFGKIQELCLYQHVRQFTRAREGQKPSLLDLIFTDEEETIEKVEVDAPIGKSDHGLLRWNLLF